MKGEKYRRENKNIQIRKIKLNNLPVLVCQKQSLFSPHA